MHTHSFMHMQGFAMFSADDISQVNRIHIHNLYHHCRIHLEFHFNVDMFTTLFFSGTFIISFFSPIFITYLSRSRSPSPSLTYHPLLYLPIPYHQYVCMGVWVFLYCLALCSVHFEEKCFDVDMYHQLMG